MELPLATTENNGNRSTKLCLRQACQSLVTHAPRTSNLAAFGKHVTRLLKDVMAASGTSTSSDGNVDHFSQRIARVGHAQAAAGALNLFRILCHAVLVHSRASSAPPDYLSQCFTYTSREAKATARETGADLISCLIQFLFALGDLSRDDDVPAPPEVYDAAVLAMELLLVLFSPQLYQPMQSSVQRYELKSLGSAQPAMELYFWDIFMQKAEHRSAANNGNSQAWTPTLLLSLWFTWQIERPPSPAKSIARHNADLARSVAQAKGESPGPDGMHESYQIVDAMSPPAENSASDGTVTSTSAANVHRRDASSNILYDATKGVLVLSSSIIFLPFRLMSLAFHLWGNKEKGYDTAQKKHLQTSFQQASRTKDVLWLSDSPLADMASCLILLVANNNRAHDRNPFRTAIANLSDNRWEADGNGLPDLPDFPNSSMGDLPGIGDETLPLVASPSRSLVRKNTVEGTGNTLSINFESLFNAFGRSVHTEVGALMLYTLMQTSNTFADSIAVRSDLDTLVLPLLRTLYFACSVRHYIGQDFSAKRRPSNETNATSSTLALRNCPFRSASQLYVIIILLLLFSQDPSFGSDAYRRVMVQSVPFYKERNLKDISLGSILILSILRCLTFNLHRLGDPFLLSNCCAILMNLSPSISDLFDYAAMRLASVTFSTMKKYSALRRENPNVDEEVDFTSPTAMYGEVSRTLLRVLKQCVAAKSVEGNLHLVYALVYHQSEFTKIIKDPKCPFARQEYSRVQKAIQAAAAVIGEADARTASKALKVLGDNAAKVREAVNDSRKKDADDFTFTYEEEADPEIFFLPYVWEVTTCAVTASRIEWQKNEILIFPLLEVEETGSMQHSDADAPVPTGGFSKDVSDVV